MPVLRLVAGWLTANSVRVTWSEADGDTEREEFLSAERQQQIFWVTLGKQVCYLSSPTTVLGKVIDRVLREKGWAEVVKSRECSPMGADREHPNGSWRLQPSGRPGVKAPPGREIPQAVRPPAAGRSCPKGAKLITIGYPLFPLYLPRRTRQTLVPVLLLCTVRTQD